MFDFDTEDMFGSDSACQIEIVIDWLKSKNLDSKTCYKEFVEYYLDYNYFSATK